MHDIRSPFLDRMSRQCNHNLALKVGKCVYLHMQLTVYTVFQASLYLGEDEHAVTLGFELVQQPVEKLQLARLLQQLLGGRVHSVVGESGGDEVWVVAVLSHLHDHVVQFGLGDLPAALCLLLLGQSLLSGSQKWSD